MNKALLIGAFFGGWIAFVALLGAAAFSDRTPVVCRCTAGTADGGGR